MHMIAGMPTHYHISCRVRNSDSGLDAQVTEHADTVIETSGTPVAALAIWLSRKDSWLVASALCIKSLLKQWKNGELDIVGWDSRDNGGDTVENGYHNDWEVHGIDHNEKEHTLFMSGTSCVSEFEFEVTIKPHDPSKVSTQEIKRTQEYIGLLGPNGELSWASDSNSQIEGSDFDGPCLWRSVDEARETNDEYGGIPDDHRLVKVTVTIDELT